MLTVKHKAPSGAEMTFEALEVVYSDRNTTDLPTIAGFGPSSGHIEFIRPNAKESTICHAYDGVVYVMNSDGKTVAKYDLGGHPSASIS